MGSAAFGLGSWYWRTRNSSAAQKQFTITTNDVSQDLEQALLQYGDLLSGSAALFHQEVVSRAQYDAFLGALGFGTTRFPAVLGIGFIRLVRHDQLPGFLASLQADGISASLDPAGSRSYYCLVDYADWSKLITSIPIFGYDFCTVPAISSTLSKATETGRQQVLAGSKLSSAYSSDFLLVRPVYSASPSSTTAHQEQVTGWALAFVNGYELIRSIAHPPGTAFWVYSGTQVARGAEPILRSLASLAPSGDFAFSAKIDAYGPWTVRFREAHGPAEPAGGISGPITLLVAGLVSLWLLVALIWSLMTARSRALREVERATRSLKSTEERFEKLVANSSDMVAVVNDKAELVYANAMAEHTFGLAAEEHVGRNTLDLIHPEDRGKAAAAFTSDVSGPGAHPPAVYRFQNASGEWRFIEVVATNCLDDPSVGGIVINARDVSESTNLTRALRTLGQANQVLVHASEEASLLADTCRTIVDAGGYLLAWVGYAEHDAACTVRPVASAGMSDYLKEIHVSWADDEHGQGPIGEAIRTRSVKATADIRHTTVPAPNRIAATKYGLRASCVLPLAIAGDVIGVLSIYADEARAFGPSEVELFSELGDALAYGIARIRDAQSLQASEQRFRSLASTAPIGILEVVPVGHVEYANARSAAISGRHVEALMGRGWIDAVHPDDVAELLTLAGNPRPDRSSVTMKCRIVHPDGEVRHVRLAAAPKGHELEGAYIVTIEDITDEVTAQEQLAHDAFYDSLTGLPNRALFLDRLNQELATQRRKGTKIAVLFLDLDRFKIVNDSLGHEAGDTVLKSLGERFIGAVRSGETAARFSGDEFMFIIRDVHEAQDAVNAARRLLAVLEPPIQCGDKSLTLTGSIGIVIPRPRTSAATILRDADTAMYQAKDAGRNRYELFDLELHRRSVKRLAMEGELRRALERGEFEVYYQPAVVPATEWPMGAEALIRWCHPARGMVSPLEFIPVAEDSGLITRIGTWVFEQAMAQLASWDSEVDGPHLQVMAVNLSARQLDDRATSDMVLEVLQRYKLDPARVALEVTESVVMADSPSTRRSLQAFRELGLRVSIDDFGTGYSSLAYLHSLPVTTVKIDRSFIERLGGSQDSTPVVKAIVDMSHALGLRVVAEGVSDVHLVAPISVMGCDVAQGFYWCPPLPPEQFADWWLEAERRVIARHPLS